MAIIIIESIGFSATHTISEMLDIDGKNKVSHGTQNFKKNTPMGQENLLFHQFYSQMIKQHDDYVNCISVHSNFDPSEIIKVITGTDTKFFGLLRKSQRNQILSCFYWAVNGFLNGRESLTRHLIQIHKDHGELFKQMGLPSNMNTCLMLYAFQHVVNFNIKLAQNTQKLFFMEDIIEDPMSFAMKIGATEIQDFSLKIAEGPSHKNEVKAYDFLINVQDILEVLIKKLTINIGEKRLNFNQIENFFSEKS
jgi:hypothetical protein